MATETENQGSDKTKKAENTDNPPQKSCWWHNPNERFTFFVATFTGLLVVVGVLQWCTLTRTDETSRLRDRAFLYLTPTVLPYPPPREVSHWGISLIMENAGVMPAEHVRLKHAFTSSKERQWSQAEWTIINFPITIGPKRQFPIQWKDIPLNIVQEIINGKAEVFLLAEVTYNDSFFPSKKRITQMKARLNADYAGGSSFSFTSDHNCTDDDCPN